MKERAHVRVCVQLFVAVYVVSVRANVLAAQARMFPSWLRVVSHSRTKGLAMRD